MNGATAYSHVIAAAQRRPPRVAFILGSGLSGLENRLTNPTVMPFRDVPGMTATSVPGHKGALHLGDWAGVSVLVFAGRLHGYEGHAWRAVTQPIQVAWDLGVEILVLTNAAGGIRDDLVPGTLMALANHLDGTRSNWRSERPASEPSPYDAALRESLQSSARRLGIELPAGIYAQMPGPCYETKAEIRALRACGADAVGMSTAREVEAAHALGLRCAAVSCITNRAAGLSAGPIHHGEVLDVSLKLRERLGFLLEGFLKDLG